MEERRIVTVLFCDVTGSTALASQLDPEDWAEIMDEAFPYLIQPVERFGGTIARLMGDAILAFFGAPHAHEDDPQRAILAGLAIVTGIQPFRERIRRRYELDFNVRVGINTGLVVVGEFGTEHAFEYTAMGDAINLAARMEQTAQSGTVQISHDTYRLVEGYFDVASLGEIEVKGKPEPVPAYRVVGYTTTPVHPRGLAGTTTPLAGRRAVLGALQTALEELRSGRGQIISLIGEPGLGKSRLLDELHQAWRSDGAMTDATNGAAAAWLQDRALSYEAMEPYGVFRKRLADGFGIMPDDSPETVHHKTVQAVAELAPASPERTTGIIESLLNVRSASESNGAAGSTLMTTGADFKRELFGHMAELFRNWNHGLPYVYVVDDVQWIDAASAELLVHLFKLTDQIPILFLCSYRPERETPAWTVKQAAETEFPHRYREITLEPLSPDDSAMILESAIAELNSTPELRTVVLQRALGNPLYVEEIVRSLIDQGYLQRDDSDPLHRWRPVSGMNPSRVQIPETLQALLLNRIDNLAGAPRTVLQRAAVIGLSFSRTILAAIADEPEQLDEQLAQLQRVELIRESAWMPEREYTFHHPLIWETAYGTILRRHRREYHRQVAQAIEAHFPGRLDDYAAALGRHYLQASDERAIEWLTRAANQALDIHDAHSAIEYSSQAMTLAERLAIDQDEALFLLRGKAHEAVGKYDDSRCDLQTALEVAREHQRPAREWEALNSLGISWAEGDYRKAEGYYRQALDLAQQIDERTRARSLNQIGNWHINVDQPQAALQAHAEALAIFERLGDRAGIAETHDLLGMANYLAGDLASQVHHLQLAIELFRELDNQPRLSMSLATLAAAAGMCHSITVPAVVEVANAWRAYCEESLALAGEVGSPSSIAFSNLILAQLLESRGKYSQALDASEQVLEIATEIGHRQWTVAAWYMYGVCYYDLLDLDVARDYFERGAKQAQEIGSGFWYGQIVAYLAATHLASGFDSQARTVLESFVDPHIATQSLAQRCCAYRLAELELASANPERALELVDLLVQTAPNMEHGAVIPHIAYLRSLALSQLDRADEAFAELEAARQTAETFGYRPLLWRIEHALGEAWFAYGDAEAARQSFESADTIIGELAADITDPALRATFIAKASTRPPGS